MRDAAARDHDALSAALRDALRHNDVETALDACGGLVGLRGTGVGQGLSTMTRMAHHTYSASKALGWALEYIEPSEDISTKAELAVRVANLARQIPDHQTMICPDCGGISHSRLSTGVSEVCPAHAIPTTMHRTSWRPAPTHALVLYVKAIQVATSLWWQWLPNLLPSGWFGPAGFPFFGHSGTDARIGHSGLVECGYILPPLPVVELESFR